MAAVMPGTLPPAADRQGSLPPPPPAWLARLRAALWPDPLSGAVSVLLIGGLLWALFELLRWAVWGAVLTPSPGVCHQAAGACWGVVVEKYRLVLFGTYPLGERWRPLAASVGLLLAVVLAAQPSRSGRGRLAALVAGFGGFVFLMAGGVAGLAPVPTDRWGGLPLTLFLSASACILALPAGIALALARRSSLPVLRVLATGLIEFVRGVPLITLLFFGAFMLPLLLPAPWRIDPMLRIGICLWLFHAAYLAEIFRGGLQSIASGQYAAAQALGLTRWQALRFVVLPQALRVTIAPTTSNFIGAVKDTSLVSIVNLYDITGSLKMALSDPSWRPFFAEMYLVVCAIYLVIGLSIAHYGRHLERKYRLP